MKKSTKKEKPLHEIALNESGFKTTTTYTNVIWFNPSYSQNVKTNIRKSIPQVKKKHFP